jgi:hypothetical protein
MADLNFPQNPQVGDTYTIGTRTWVWNGSGWALQSGIISTNPFIVVSAQITTATNSTSTNSGALVVTGGAGFGGDIWAKDIYSNGSQVVTTASIGNFGVSAIQAGTDTAVANLIGNVVLIWNTSTLQSVSDRGATTTNIITFANVTNSTSTETGAVIITGGVGVAQDITVGGKLRLATDYTISVDTTDMRFDSASSSSNYKWYAGTDTVMTVTGTGTLSISRVDAVEVYDNSTRVLTSVTPVGGNAISISAVSTSNANTTFTVNNEGVTSAVGTTYLGVSTSTGTVTFTNLGVQSLTGTDALGVSASTGTITLTNLGVTSASGTTYLGVSASTGSITFTNLGVQTLTAGTDTSVSQSTGTVTIWNTSTLQTVTSRGATTDQVVSITNATGANTSTGGALQVTGGVGIGENLYVQGTLNVVGKTVFADTVVFNGTATYVLTTNTVYTDNILELHTTATGASTTWAFDDGKDIGLRFHYYNRTLATGTNAGLVLANDTQWLEWYGSGVEGDNVFTGTQYGVFKTGSIRLANADVNLQNTTTGALTVAGGVGIFGTQYIAGTGGVANNAAVDQQALIVAANGLGVNGNSYFTNNIGVGGNLSVTGTSVLSSAIVANNFTATGASTLNGAVTANSSLGVQGNFAVTGTSILTGNVTATNNLSVGGNFDVTGTTVLTGITTIVNVTDSASTDSGALVVSGGAGFGGNLTVGGNLNVVGIINATVEGSISTATHIAGGATGAIPYQTAFGRTSFINPGVAGTILTSNGTGSQPTYQNTLTLAGNANAVSTNSGALQVVGGLGVGRDAWIGGDLYVSGNQVLTTGTIGEVANLTIITAGTDTAVSTATGNIVIWNTSTLQSVSDRGATTTNIISFANTANSTSTETGAVVIAGGLGVGHDVWIGGDLNVEGDIFLQGVGLNTISGSTGTFDFIFVEGAGTGLSVSNNAIIGGNLTATTINVVSQSTLQNVTANITTVSNLIATDSALVNGVLTATTLNVTGTSTLVGDVGIYGNLFTTGTTTLAGAVTLESTLGVRGNFNVTGTSVLTGAVHSIGNLGVSGNFNVTGTTTLSSITATIISVTSTATLAGDVLIGQSSQYTSYQSTTATTTATISLDSFVTTEYRTVKYLVQVTDTSVTPNKVHVAEFLVFHDNNGVSTQAYVIQYGIGSNTGELGIWDAVYNGGTITLQFTPNYTPGALTVKTVRTAITT